eukprot:1151654-Pelagomonas_calceolata.AAC.5
MLVWTGVWARGVLCLGLLCLGLSGLVVLVVAYCGLAMGVCLDFRQLCAEAQEQTRWVLVWFCGVEICCGCLSGFVAFGFVLGACSDSRQLCADVQEQTSWVLVWNFGV